MLNILDGCFCYTSIWRQNKLLINFSNQSIISNMQKRHKSTSLCTKLIFSFFLNQWPLPNTIEIKHISFQYLIIIMNSIIVLLVLLVTCFSISIPVNSDNEKCMVVYSTREDEYLKLDIKFEKFNGQTDQEYYLINLYNTETSHIQSFNVTEGLFRREILLTQGVIYRLCMKIILNRYGSGQIQKYVQYNTAIKHDVDSDTKIQIPPNLLKIKDLQRTYQELLTFGKANQFIKKQATKIQKEQDEIFKEQEEKIKSIEWITIIEFTAITAFGLYQFFRLRHIIDNKQR